MKRDELENLINQEIKKELKVLVPKLVKPLVQEAVAGALANLLAEGIVKGTSPIRENVTRSNIEKRPIPSRMVPEDPQQRRKFLRDQMGFEPVSKIGNSIKKPSYNSGNNVLDDILSETANNMIDTSDVDASSVPSILDNIDHLDEASMSIIVKDYSTLMERLNKKTK